MSLEFGLYGKLTNRRDPGPIEPRHARPWGREAVTHRSNDTIADDCDEALSFRNPCSRYLLGLVGSEIPQSHIKERPVSPVQ